MQYEKVMIPSWRQTDVAPEETHHLADGRPLYEARFSNVLSFHAPGLAAVRDGRGAYHINIYGEAAYPAVFVGAFGFYQNMAAVQNSGGEWFHITPGGRPAYEARYRWCGNFQNGYSVARHNKGYGHIFPDGRLLSKTPFLYAGDFRGLYAVVRLESGLCTHITREGNFLHSRYYRDLDVYHKGFARARDEGGWMHVDKKGIPAYQARFAGIEPFYNGRALAETHDGRVLTINDRGENCDIIMPPQSPGAGG